MRFWILGLAASVGCAAHGMGGTAVEGEPDAGLEPMDAGDGEPCNGLDDDGDGRVDEGCSCEPGQEQPCFRGDPALAGVGACRMGTQRCASDFEFGTWDRCFLSGEPSEEVCDGVDNDCDGETDEGCECADGERRACYSGTAGTEGVGMCRSGIERCVAGAWSGCEDERVDAEETCDGFEDEDCDGRIDEGCACPLGAERSCYGGWVGTLDVGACRAGVQRCAADGWGACEGAITPADEVCSGGVDEDCDGLVDCADPDCDARCCVPWGESVPVVPPEGEIVFLVDRSGSMLWDASGGTSRWQALLDAMGTVLPLLDDLQLGMMTFPHLDGTDERYNCAVASSPDVPLMFGAGPTIEARLLASTPRAGDTPTPAAFDTVQSYLSTHPSSRPRFVVLATDGLPEPNCGATVDATVAAISRLRGAGIDTFVLGIVGPDSSGSTAGIPALQDGLNRMADAGGRARPGAIRYYEAVDAPALTTAMESIIAAAADCQFELASDPPRGAGSVEVLQDGVVVPSSGWTLTGRTLRFRGAYCDAIQLGAVRAIDVRDGC